MQNPNPSTTARNGARRRVAVTVALVAAFVLGAAGTAQASSTHASTHATPPAAADRNVAPASVGGPATRTGTAQAVTGTAQAVTGASLCAQVGANAGFPRNDTLVTAVAVGLAESSCSPSAQGANGPTSGCPGGSVDRGLWQINSCYHAEVSDSCAYNAQCNANAAYTISAGGTNWTPWSTYNSGAYRGYLTQAKAAVDGLCGGACGSGTIAADPSVNVRSGPSTSASIVGHATYQQTVAVVCWTTGDYVAQGYWPSAIWDSVIYSGTGARGYVADTWLRTSADIRGLVRGC